MVECKEFVGKVISSFKLYEDTIDSPEIWIEFTDGTVFSSCLKTSTALKAKVTRNEGGHPRLLKIRNIMSALYSHAMRYEWSDKNPIKLVRQSAKENGFLMCSNCTNSRRFLPNWRCASGLWSYSTP